MTFEKFRQWCNERACDGYWGNKEAEVCMEIIDLMTKIPFWKRNKVWKRLETRLLSVIVNPVNKRIKAVYCDGDVTMDVVKVVRCKYCKHWQPVHEHIRHMECEIFCGTYEHGYPTNADDFCSYGERRTDDELAETSVL